MPIKQFSLSDITSRIMLTLPSRFTKEEGTNIYKFFETIADSFSIDTAKLDELILQTNIDSASGDYLDQYINGLAGFGRLRGRYQDSLSTEDEFEIIAEDGDLVYLPTFSSGEVETDQEYRDRYNDVLYTYNCSKDGIRQIIIDFTYMYPTDMYSGSKRGAHYSGTQSHAKRFFSDPTLSKYGAGGSVAYVGYIELAQRPDERIINILCDHVEQAKGYGIKLYIKYPL
jgi:hypothetical protein